ncbi:MAG: DNA-formamidopyrimidine glycosylase family protein [Tepidisphaeraceae bacterium]
MPEGPTLHRLARDHTELFAGQKLSITSPQGRFAEAAATIDGKKLIKAEAWGKHLFYDFAGGRVLHVHLGLYGKFRVAAFAKSDGPPEPRGAVRVRFVGKTHTLDLNGPNQCEVIDTAARDDILSRLGPDPLRDDADADQAWQRIAGSRQSIGQLLMDQNVIAGVGNIYRAEMLWQIKLHPRTPGKAVTKKQFDAMWHDAVRWMRFAVDFGMIVTTALTEKKNPPKKPSAAERFNIYKQPKCPRCGGAIETYALVGRKVYACAGCQTVQEAWDVAARGGDAN